MRYPSGKWLQRSTEINTFDYSRARGRLIPVIISTLADPSTCWNRRRDQSHRSEPREQFKILRRDRSGDTFYRRAHLRFMATGKDTSRQCQDGNDRHRRYSGSRALPGKKSADERLALITHRSTGNILAPVIIGCRARDGTAMKISRAVSSSPWC